VSETRVDFTLETLVEFAALHRKQVQEMGEHFEASMVKINSTMDELAIQTAQLDSQIKKTNQTVERLDTAVDGHLAVARTHSENVAQLFALAQAQQEAAQQQQTLADRLLEKSS